MKTSTTFLSFRLPILVLSLVLASVTTFAQDIQGSFYPIRSTTTTYTFTPPTGNTIVSGSWSLTGGRGTITSQTITSTSATATVSWTSNGQATLTLNSNGSPLAVKAIIVTSTSCSGLLKPGLPIGAYEGKYSPGQPATLHLTPGSNGNDVLWSNTTVYSEAAGDIVKAGNYFTTPALNNPATFYARSINKSNGCTSNSQAIAVSLLESISSVKQELVRVEGITTPALLQGLNNTQKSTSMAYLDGLGRVTQSVVLQGSNGSNDIVLPIEYDKFGRASKQYLPYTISSPTPGSFHASFENELVRFYETANDKIADDTEPYAVSKYESSPLGRLIEQDNYGKLVDDVPQSTRVRYEFNTASEVRMMQADGSSTQFYGANTLNKIINVNPNGHSVIVFADKTGRTLLKKQQLDETIDGTLVDYLETYYIYDDMDRIKYVISPKGVAALKSGGWAFTAAIKDNYTYQFVYDKRGRVIEKKVPGQAWMYYGYDNLNRLVLMQDGLLQAQNKWLFIKYDQNSRPVMQGLYKNTTDLTRAAIQAVLDGLYTAGNSAYPAANYFEIRGTALHGYTNRSFPKTNKDNTALEVLSVNYYDKYDFDNNGTDDYTYAAQGLIGEHTQGRAYLMPTGSKRLVLGTTTWLYTYVFYDKYGRPIQVRSNNHLSTAIDNLKTNVYDFESKLQISKNYHNAGSGKITTVINKYTYTAQGKLLEVIQSNDGAADQVVARYEYNELGQLVDKKLHNTGGANFLQSIDYRYTIQGQLASLNNAQLSSDGGVTNDETTDYFGMEFLYNTVESGLNNTAYFNGNISAVKWKALGDGTGASGQKAYTFLYDKSQKLKTATFKAKGTSAWDRETNAFNESMSYDHNGNIKTLTRNQRKHQISGINASYVSENMDNLTYTYHATIGDQLLKVTDGTGMAAGFNNGTSGTTDDFTYDVNGNLTADLNKGISSVVYNFMGKPSQVNFADGRKIDYVYDAAGVKLTVKNWQGATLVSTTDYVNGFVYENNALSFFGSPEGRVVKNGSNLEYQYAIADNQGNTRMVFTSAPSASAPQSTAVNYEVTSNANVLNYPSGGSRSGNELYDHTDVSGSAYTYSHLLNGGNNSQVGVAKSYKVYPGDKVKIEAYAKYANANSNNSNLAAFATALTGAFGVNAASTGEAGLAYQTLNYYGGVVAGGSGPGSSSYPKMFVTILIFDKDYKFLDIAYEQIDGGEQVGVTPKASHDYMMKEYTVKQEGYAYAYISNENPTYVEGYFDDVTFTYTPSNIIQYNEYYPFGLQTSNSWTRQQTTGNNFLYNEGNELNQTSGWYEMFYRGYDPALGRMLQIDPYAAAFSSYSPYHYALNNPIRNNDPSGGYVVPTFTYYYHSGYSIGSGMSYSVWAETHGHIDGSNGYWVGTTHNGSYGGSPSAVDKDENGNLVIDIDKAPYGTTTYANNGDGSFSEVEQNRVIMYWDDDGDEGHVEVVNGILMVIASRPKLVVEFINSTISDSYSYKYEHEFWGVVPGDIEGPVATSYHSIYRMRLELRVYQSKGKWKANLSATSFVSSGKLTDVKPWVKAQLLLDGKPTSIESLSIPPNSIYFKDNQNSYVGDITWDLPDSGSIQVLYEGSWLVNNNITPTLGSMLNPVPILLANNIILRK